MSDIEAVNFLRNNILIIDIGGEVLKYLLDFQLVNVNLSIEGFINKYLHEIYHMCYPRRCCQCPGGRIQVHTRRILTEAQLKILLDRNGHKLQGHSVQSTSTFCCLPAHSNLSNKNFDVSLLRCLLLHFGTILKSNASIQISVDTILHYRNKYAHTTTSKVSNVEFKKNRSEIETAILEIASFCNVKPIIEQKISNLNNRQSFSEYDQILVENMENMKKRLQEIETKQSQFEYKSTSQRIIIELSEYRIKSHEDDKTYVRTHVVDAADEILQQNNMLVLISKAGGGKTKLALQLAHIYHRRKYTPIIFVDNQITEKIDLIQFKEEYFVIIEDMFGRTNIEYNEDVHKNTLDNLMACLSSAYCKTKIIFSIRSHGNRFQRILSQHELFENTKIVNLDHEYQLKKAEVEDILFKHMDKWSLCLCDCKDYNKECCCTVNIQQDGKTVLGRKMIAKIIEHYTQNENNKTAGFPQACHIFCSNKNMTKLGIGYFKNTSRTLVDEFKRMKREAIDNQSVRYQYCILLYTAVKGYIDSENIDGILVMRILSNFKSEKNVSSIPNHLIKDMLITLEGTFLVSGYLFQRFKTYLKLALFIKRK